MLKGLAYTFIRNMAITITAYFSNSEIVNQTLGDHAAAPRYIETVPRLGYRFVHPVTKSPRTEAMAGKRVVLGQSAEIEKTALLSELSKLKASLLPS